MVVQCYNLNSVFSFKIHFSMLVAFCGFTALGPNPIHEFMPSAIYFLRLINFTSDFLFLKTRGFILELLKKFVSLRWFLIVSELTCSILVFFLNHVSPAINLLFFF